MDGSIRLSTKDRKDCLRLYRSARAARRSLVLRTKSTCISTPRMGCRPTQLLLPNSQLPRHLQTRRLSATLQRRTYLGSTTELQIPTDGKASKHHRADARRSPGRSRGHNARRASSVSWGVLRSTAFRLVHRSRTRAARGPLAHCGKSSDLFLSP